MSTMDPLLRMSQHVDESFAGGLCPLCDGPLAPGRCERKGVELICRGQSTEAPATEPTATMADMIARIEADARDLLALAPQSPPAQALLDAIVRLRRAARPPLPEGWRWSRDGYLVLSGRGWNARTFANGRWMIFAGFSDDAPEVCHGREVDEDVARAVVEEHFWQHGWPS